HSKFAADRRAFTCALEGSPGIVTHCSVDPEIAAAGANERQTGPPQHEFEYAILSFALVPDNLLKTLCDEAAAHLLRRRVQHALLTHVLDRVEDRARA